MPRNLILCFDGTWNKPLEPISGDAIHDHTPDTAPVENPENTNVVKLKRLIEQNQGDQVLIYFNGVGTDWYDHLRGGASGEGLSKRIRLGYYHLAENYNFGDRIFLFGFSRGAYTARSLAGFIRKCGLLQVANPEVVETAYALYRRRDPTPDEPDIVQFRKEYSTAVEIQFIGVWDTVGALGIPLSFLEGLNQELWGFHDTSLSSIVRNGYHALAIDEHRVQFSPALWTSDPGAGQNIEQCWFVGAHSNVGGGYPDARLSDVALEWMCQKAAACGLRLAPFAAPPDCCLGLIRDSYREFVGGLPQFDPPFFRPVQMGKYQQTLHPSVVERVQRGPEYRPENLAAVLSSLGIA